MAPLPGPPNEIVGTAEQLLPVFVMVTPVTAPPETVAVAVAPVQPVTVTVGAEL